MNSSLNSQIILEAINALEKVIAWRIKQFQGKNEKRPVWQIPSLKISQDPIANTLKKLTEDEALILIMALCPNVHPIFFDQVIATNLPESGTFPPMGGVRGKQFLGFLPTGETVLFVLAGNDLAKRLEVQQMLNQEYRFYKERILWLENALPGEPQMSGKLILSPEYLELFTTGRISRPKFSTEFPAKQIETQLEWNDLILPSDVKQQIRDLENWIKHSSVLMNDWGMRRRIKPGYRVLLYGPPGTGKTMTATLLGKYTGRDVFRIDLSTVVSKYIGETEKNLSSLFDKAENKKWILFFDEADSLFGKRTGVRDAHDKYANQEVSYLLQRLEAFDGLVILASNFKSNIDEAFMRRFQAIIKFPLPSKHERQQIWSRSLPKQLSSGNGVPINEIIKKATKYDLSGGNIINVVQFASLKYLAGKDSKLRWEYFSEGIKREYEKEGKVFSE